MPRMSKKRREEWSFFLNRRNRITYNPICRGCTQDCKGEKYDTVFKRGETALWTYKAVQRILSNEVYIGVLAQGKRGTPNHKVRVVQKKDESEWIKVENAHEALVSYEDFIVNEYIKKIVVYAPDKSSGHRMQELKIYFNFLDETEMPLVSEPIICKRTYKMQKTA